MKIQPDHKRIAMMEKNIADIHRWFESDGKGKAGILFRHQFKKHYFILPPPWRILWRMRTANKRMLPDFCSTGAIRSGTSSMSNYILQHPAVVMPLSKELGALSPRLNAIRAQFPLQNEAEKTKAQYGMAITGDCTPVVPGLTQLYWSRAINPDMKYIITLRDPVERTLSHWRWHKMITKVFDHDALWQTMPDMETCLQKEMQYLEDGGTGFITFCGASSTDFVRQSCYLPFLKELFSEVGADKIKIVRSEDLFEKPDDIAAEVYEFLGLPDYTPVHIKETNPSEPIPVSDTLRDDLKAFFKPFNEKLYDYLGSDFHWQ